MNHSFKIPVIVLIMISSTLCLISCKKNPTPPVVTTSNVTEITQTTALTGGNVTSDGHAAVTSRGVCWNSSGNPTVSNSKTSDGTGTGSFTSSLTQLTPGTNYYVKAYATNSEGTSYGSQISFNSNPIVLATLTTTTIGSITSTTAVSGGNITDDGGGTITARGVCWSKTQNPTTTDSNTTDGTGTGSFTSNLTGLNVSTTYYVRAYATNRAGTAYGDEKSFTTDQLKDADGNVYTYVTIGTQTWMVENLKTTKLNDGTAITYVTDGSAWYVYSTPAFCFYNVDENIKSVYGALYNWYAVNTGKLCPTGWHVPSLDELDTLGVNIANLGGKLKEVGTSHWETPNGGATNETGFTALPGGWCNSYVTPWDFRSMGEFGYWWSNTTFPNWYSGTYAYSMNLSYVLPTYEISENLKTDGLSVRCLKN